MTNPALQLRLVLETEDLDAALAFYRDALGLTPSSSPTTAPTGPG